MKLLTTSIMPDEHKMAEFVEKANSEKNRPLVMVNLLRFAEEAQYEGEQGVVISGRKAYERYSKAVTPMLWRTGGQLLWMGKVKSALIAPVGEEWDEVLLVHYPNRQAFLNMVTSDEYQAIVHHRTAALVDSRLIETQTVKVPKPVLAVAKLATRMKSKVGFK